MLRLMNQPHLQDENGSKKLVSVIFNHYLNLDSNSLTGSSLLEVYQETSKLLTQFMTTEKCLLVNFMIPVAFRS